MEKNDGMWDRCIRVVIGLVAIYLGVRFSAWWYILAAIALITAATGSCLLYRLFGWNTAECCESCETKQEMPAKKVSKKKKA